MFGWKSNYLGLRSQVDMAAMEVTMEGAAWWIRLVKDRENNGPLGQWVYGLSNFGELRMGSRKIVLELDPTGFHMF